MLSIQVCSVWKFYKKEEKETGRFSGLRFFLRRKYREIKALADISFEIPKGEMVGIIGPNGAGKTTLLKILSGVVTPNRGEVRVMGFDPLRRKREFLEKITFFTGQRGFLSLTIWDLPPLDGYELIRHIYGISRRDFERRLGFFIELLDIGELVKTPLKKLSLGERTKVELIASLLHCPEVVFLDEPTIGLDIVSQKQLWEFFRVYNEERKATVLITSHYTRDIEELGRRILILYKGKLLYDGDRKYLMDMALDRKVLRVVFKEVPPEGLSGWEIKGNTASKVVDRRLLGEELRHMMRFADIQDVSVEELPFEDVIREIFLRGEVNAEIFKVGTHGD